MAIRIRAGRVANLHYFDTVESDVYLALRERINLFETFVGNLQPILARLPRAIEEIALSPADARERETAAIVDGLDRQVRDAEEGGFDLDEIAWGGVDEGPRSPAPYSLSDLGRILQRTELLPPGDEVSPLGLKDYALLRPGMDRPVRVTTDPEYYEQHADSVELWSPGSPVFPEGEQVGDSGRETTTEEFRDALG